MKMIKVDDDIHAKLKLSDKSINRTLRDLVFGRPETDLEVVLEQMHMRFDSVDVKLASPQNFSENTKGVVPFSPSDEYTEVFGKGMASMDRIIETPAEKAERVRKEHQERVNCQQHAIEHPEDFDQSGGWK